ncbi:Extradiol ring-cleavage dioxygenase, class III enzyme, subunit B [Crucibulum laeve]|uniref:Extradiol ring-cleavage dioxygenase, class III enzyme, subunit B n=1 Tax=Crucibulum laeve TaxID=68775 RepID=A0A5C3MBF7_9AGAR|nr:Extradiol ring-cleavage dioxygenase, class III enzyme, subunit B [Crucibulum laeve]
MQFLDPAFFRIVSLFLLGLLTTALFSSLREPLASTISSFFPKLLTPSNPLRSFANNSSPMASLSDYRRALDDLPATPNKIPAFFFGHGSPFLAFPESEVRSGAYGAIGTHIGPTGPLASFLKAFGPTLLEKYKPRGIVVFSAHWETNTERLVTDYGDENPLLMDYYGFQPEMYRLKFKSKGDSKLSQRVVDLLTQAGQKARTTSKLEPRGEDGRGFSGPGLDHGVFVPFRLMFGEEFTEIPIVQVSIESNLKPEDNWSIGKAVSQLREEGILVLSGGLTAHNLRDRASFTPETARPSHKAFDKAIHDAVNITDDAERKKAMFALTKHSGFRDSQPREEHFVPIYVAAGAGEGGDVRVVCNMYGAPTIAFGI